MDKQQKMLPDIIVKSNINYLSDVIDQLPSKTLFHKGVTGSGGSTMELTCKTRHSIIAVPTISLALNKSQQYNKDGLLNIKMLAVHGEINNEDGIVPAVDTIAIMTYMKTQLENNEKIKIIGTYDSLVNKIELAFLALGMNAKTDAFLLIDEYHEIFKYYKLRRNAIRSLLETYSTYDNYCLMTATPLKKGLTLSQFEKVPFIQNVIWPHATKVKINAVVTTYVVNEAVHMIKDAFTIKGYGNLYFFVNSVTIISKIMERMARLNKKSNQNIFDLKQVRVSCSENEKNENKVGKKYINNDHTVIKKITFLTSKSFAGIDIYDTEGRICAISDGNAANTLIDISTDLKQVVGRIRNSTFSTELTHIMHTRTRHFDEKGDPIGNEDFLDVAQKTKELGHEWVETLNDPRRKRIREEQIKITSEEAWNGRYIDVDGEKYTYDRNLPLIDVARHENAIAYGEFTIISKLYRRNGFVYSNDVENVDPVKYTDILLDGKGKPTFKKLFISYADLMNRTDDNVGESIAARLEAIRDCNKLVQLAYDKLGTKRVEEMNFKVGNIKRVLKTVSVDAILNIIINDLDERMGADINLSMKMSALKEIVIGHCKNNNAKGIINIKSLSNAFIIKTSRKKITTLYSNTDKNKAKYPKANIVNKSGELFLSVKSQDQYVQLTKNIR